MSMFFASFSPFPWSPSVSISPWYPWTMTLAPGRRSRYPAGCSRGYQRPQTPAQWHAEHPQISNRGRPSRRDCNALENLNDPVIDELAQNIPRQLRRHNMTEYMVRETIHKVPCLCQLMVNRFVHSGTRVRLAWLSIGSCLFHRRGASLGTDGNDNVSMIA
jgi:hypothetical protein